MVDDASALRRWRRVRVALALVYVVVFVQQEQTKGFPFDRERLILWIAAALAVSCVGRSWRRVGHILLDWVPLALVLIVYDISRGLADNLGAPVQRRLPIAIDRAIFFGELPNVWLQQRILPTGPHIAWWELAMSIIYASHFVLPILTAGILWAGSRAEWRRWVNRFLLVTIGGLVTYAVLPVAPPWMAAQQHLIAPLERPIGRGWGRVHFSAAAKLLDEGRITLNPVAAVPSMHAAYSMLLVAFCWKRIEQPLLRWTMLIYPLAMAFSLVYGAEHYVIDIVAGWFYLWLAFVTARRAEGWWAHRRTARQDVANHVFTEPLEPAVPTTQECA